VRILLLALAAATLVACNSTDRTAMTGALQEINKALAPLAVFKVGT
jgi:hypothetical protein